MNHLTVIPTNLTDADLTAFLDGQFQLRLNDCSENERA